MCALTAVLVQCLCLQTYLFFRDFCLYEGVNEGRLARTVPLDIPHHRLQHRLHVC